MWRLLSSRAGLDMRDLIEAAHSYKSVEKYTNKSKIMEYMVQNIDQYASNPRRSRNHDSLFQRVKYFGESLFCGSGIYLGNYLVTTYFFIKLVYLFNSIVQFFVMNEFLGKQFHELGIDILRYLTNTYNVESQMESVYFPKVVMCDFRIREFGHPNFSHRYTIQCVLPINLYNQQIFTFLWFWFLILFFANFWALCQWINRMMPRSRKRYINRRLNMLKYFKKLNQTTAVMLKTKGIFGKRKSVSIEAKKLKRIFVDEYLKFDGVFILRMISMLTSEIVGTELLHELWNKRAVFRESVSYTANYDKRDSNHSEPPYSANSRHSSRSNTVFVDQAALPNGNDHHKPHSIRPQDTLGLFRQQLTQSRSHKMQDSYARNNRSLSSPYTPSSMNNKPRSGSDSTPSKSKKVAFAVSEEKEIEDHFSGIQDVFSDLKFDHLNS